MTVHSDRFPRGRHSALARRRRVTFVTAGATATLLLLGVIMQRTLPAARAVGEQAPRPDFAALLGTGGIEPSATVIIAELPQPSYVVAYGSGTARAALVSWDRDAGQYVAGTPVTLSADSGADTGVDSGTGVGAGTGIGAGVGGARLTGVTSLTLSATGDGATMVLARGPAEGFGEGVAGASASGGGAVSGGAAGADAASNGASGTFLLARLASGLQPVQLVGEDGVRRSALLPERSSPMRSDELTFEDVNADGKPEAVATERVADAKGVAHTIARVYVWREGALVYDPSLSTAIETSKGLFPEPPAQE